MLFDTKYLYIHDENRSKEFSVVRTCVNVGADEIKRPWDVKYRVGIAGENVGIPLEIAAAKERARDLLRKRPIGDTIVLQRLRSDNDSVADQVRFRKVTKKPPVASTEGVLGIDRMCGWVNAEARAGRLKGVRYAGICVCKPDSDHADCAAVDIFAEWASMEKIENEFWSKPDYYNAKYSILGSTIRFFGHAEHYGGVYHAHNHLSVTGGVPGSAC
jgi:hypothetical protein